MLLFEISLNESTYELYFSIQYSLQQTLLRQPEKLTLVGFFYQKSKNKTSDGNLIVCLHSAEVAFTAN